MGALSRYLNSREIQLILMPIPNKAAVYKDRVPENYRSTIEPNLDCIHFCRLLKNEGVKTVNLLDVFTPNATGMLWYYRDDTHWNELARGKVAEILAENVSLLLDL